ncbi:MAG: hypothetical protein J6386_17820 [Candidatus Synoicihabitans palmerolidicus]|nr:hypothetical protein [Candidatus Synoicihabitans palmerolidicus]
MVASARDVQHEAWKNVQQLVQELSKVDAAKHPGVAALVKDLRAKADAMDAGVGGFYLEIDPEALIAENPNYWRAALELAPGDSTLAVLEVMVMVASGDIEGASDVLELVRAGPLTDENLDGPMAKQRRMMASWRLNPPGLDLMMIRGLPAKDRWEPGKRLQAENPESGAVALVVLRMRTDLAGVTLTAEGEGQRMRNKILEAKLPLWAAIVKAKEESGDAAKRIAEMMTPDETGIVNFSEDDLAKLVADFDRVELPDWALRLQMGEWGEANASDQAAWRQLLPRMIGEAAAPILDDWEAGRVATVTLHERMDEPDRAGGLAHRPRGGWPL